MDNEQRPRKKFPKWPFIVLAILLLIGGAGYYFYNKYIAQDRWKPYLQQQLQEAIISSSDSLYHIQYSDFDLNLASGDAILSDFKLIPDTNVYNRLVAQKKAPDNIYALRVKKLTIKNVGARKAYQEKILNINRIIIDNPDLLIVNKRLHFNDSVKVGKPKTPYQLIKKIFKQLRIDSIALNDISLKYVNKNYRLPKKNTLKHVDISISDVYIDSLSEKDSSRFYYTRGVQLKVHDYKLATPDSLYYAVAKQISFSTAQRNLILDKVALQPRYSKKAFYDKIRRPQERYDLRFNRIAINDIDLQRFLRNQQLYAGTININKPFVEIYNNNAYKKHVKTSKIGKDPHQALQRVALDMKLTRLNIYDADVTYAEADARTGFTGTILFKHTSGYLTNVTNDPAAKAKNHYMSAHLRTRFMNAGDLQLNLRFNLNDPKGGFTYSGVLGRFDGRVLDKLVKPLALVHVQSADVQKLVFNVSANNYFGRGNLKFYYKNLNVQLLKKEEGVKQLQTQGLISKIANTLIIEDSNPDKKGNFRPGPINFRREPTLSFFSFLYKNLLDGLKPSVGFDEKTENRVNKTVETVTKTVEKVNGLISDFKQFREDRRKKRAERKAQKEAEKKKAEAAEKKQKEEAQTTNGS
uniref:hypothetical protein n=1 Tax=Mucilaginibacter sp. Bleaf8 TaxID=2834430 RepID=UPI001BCB5808|nr:hypothetical protein [Mucilaginibacter sp. Bleaf8]